MIIYGKLNATYIATKTVASKNRTKKNNNSDGAPFQITELNNINDFEVKEITSEEEKKISKSHATFKLSVKADFNRSTISVNTLQNTIELYDIDWNNIELFKTSILNLHKTSRGYYNKNLINSPVQDNLFALLFNLFIYPLASIFSKNTLPKTKEVYIGHLESEFKTTIIIPTSSEISNTTEASYPVNDLITNIDDEINDANNSLTDRDLNNVNVDPLHPEVSL